MNTTAEAATRRRRRGRRRRAHRRVRAAARVRRHALRSRAAPRWARPHPRRRHARRPRRPRRQRVHRAQPEHVPHLAAPLRRARRGDATHRHEHVGAVRRLRTRVRRRQGARRDVRPGGQRRQPAVPPDARGGEALPPRRPSPARRRRRSARGPGWWPADAGRVPRRRRLHAVLPPALHGAARVVRVVVRAAHRAALPGPLAVHVPRSPRCAERHRLARVAHRRRRLTQLRRARRQGAHRHRAVDAGAQRARAPPTGVEIRDDADDLRTYDAAVVATHADDALGLLVEPTAAERATLGAFRRR